MVRSLRRSQPQEIMVGVDSTVTIPLWGSDGAALSVTGKTGEFRLYQAIPRRGRKPWRGNPVLTLTSAAGQIALSSGSAAVTIADTDLSRKSGLHWFVLLLTTTATGAIEHAAQGRIDLKAAPAS